MAKRPRIAVVGSANVDLTTFSDQFPKPGETIFAQKFDLGFGGKGANQAGSAPVYRAAELIGEPSRGHMLGPESHQDFQKLGIQSPLGRQGRVGSTQRAPHS